VVIGVDVGGLKLSPKPGTEDLPDWLQSILRLQTADLTLFLYRNEAEDQLEFRSVRLILSGGAELEFDALVRGAGLSRASLMTGALTELFLRWKNDGRISGPAMEAAGRVLDDGAIGPAALAAARSALLDIADALPADSLFGGSLDEVKHLIRDLPHGRGRLAVRMWSSTGIGAVQLALLGLADDPTGPEALGRLFAETALAVDWQPGLQP
jgi:hypothetical protein